MSRLSTRHLGIAEKEGTGGCCEACGRAFQNPIQLTNLSASPTEVYNACPFCFSRQTDTLESPRNPRVHSIKEPEETTEPRERDPRTSEQFVCPHFVGYLKKRPKNSPIPEYCLTCEKMIQCLL